MLRENILLVNIRLIDKIYFGSKKGTVCILFYFSNINLNILLDINELITLENGEL